jgi:hypothetical protein
MTEKPPFRCVICGEIHGDRGAAIACCARFGRTPPGGGER